MHLILFDDHAWDNLLPLTFTRPAAGLRVGIFTIAEKWARHLDRHEDISYMTREHLAARFPANPGEDNLLVNGSLLPNREIAGILSGLQAGKSLKKGDRLLGTRVAGDEVDGFDPAAWLDRAEEYPGPVDLADYPWKIFLLNGQEIRSDFELAYMNESPVAPADIQVFGEHRLFIEHGFKGARFTVNTTKGPVFLGRDSEIMEGSLIRGPFALCEESVVKMGAKIYGPTTIGPGSKVGGEINNAVFQGNSNKAHDGFLGNAVIGEWCNLGADTNNSNLKNNYTEVKVWNYPLNRFMKTGLQFCGMIMGDHSRCGINTMFNTGTVVGVSSNIFGSGFPRNFIPSFSWGGAAGMLTYNLDKALETAYLVMKRREVELTREDEEILGWVYNYSARYRK